MRTLIALILWSLVMAWTAFNVYDPPGNTSCTTDASCIAAFGPEAEITSYQLDVREGMQK